MDGDPTRDAKRPLRGNRPARAVRAAPRALLRSVAVAPEFRSQGVGAHLVDQALAMAERAGVATVFLLTNTAATFFPRFGFERIPRDQVPQSVQQSVEFVSTCCASAVVMRKTVAGRA